METIQLRQKYPRESWIGYQPTEADYDYLFSTKDIRVLRPDGSTLLVYKKRGLSAESVARAWKTLRGLQTKSNNRAVASGQKVTSIVRQDGTLSKQRITEEAISTSILGFFGRSQRFPYCRACAFNLQHPGKFAELLPMCQEVSAQFEREVPERHAVQKDYVSRTHPAYVIPGTVFSTLTVNKNFRTSCHLDAGDLEEGFSCLSVIRQGKYSGGYLVLPEWRIAVSIDTCDLALFQAHEWHGNTEIKKLTPRATRCSIVYYYRENILKCLAPEEELSTVKHRVLGTTLY